MRVKTLIVLLIPLVWLISHEDILARGRGGGGGGGGRAAPTRSGGGGRAAASRPGGGAGRPNAGAASRPNIGGGSRPNVGGGNRPNLGSGNRPGIGDDNRPGLGVGNRPGIGEGNRPGLGAVNRPGVGGINRPGVGNGLGNVNRAGAWNRGNIGNNVNINNNRNNFAVANGNRWNNGWHHGYWGGSHWGAGWGGAAGWGLGYGMGYRRGYWNGFYNRPWFAASAMYGMGAWALGSVFYDSGYGVYGNPYYTSGAGYYDYSQPIQVVAQNTAQVDLTADDAAPPPEVLASQSHVDVARDSFAAGNYAIAGKEIDLAIKELPTDAALHEFRALVYFATADYTKAAGALYAVLSAGPGWDWTTMSGLYSSIATYSTQLRALEKYVKDEPEAADARFVLAYHYITASNKKAAVRQLQEVVRLFPDDQLSMQLLQGLGGDDPGTRPAPAAQDPQVAGDDQPQPPDIDAAAVVGRRTARRADGTSFTLNLTADDKFTWAYERGGKKQEFGGTYSIDGAVLVLERSDKATMPGLVTMDNDGFNFKLFGAPEDDPGLDFKS